MLLGADELGVGHVCSSSFFVFENFQILVVTEVVGGKFLQYCNGIYLIKRQKSGEKI